MKHSIDRLGHVAAHVLQRLTDYRLKGIGEGWTAPEPLAKSLGYSRALVLTTLGRLESQGMVERRTVMGATHYRLKRPE